MVTASAMMKCFHFTNGERSDDDCGGGGGVDGGGGGGVSRSSVVSWARSFSVASSSVDTTTTTRRSEYYDSESRDLSDSVSFHEFLSQRRANDLRVFTFSELKLATKGFSRGSIIGEGGFGCVYRGVVRVCGLRIDVAVKQLNRNGFQGHKEWINEVNVLGVVKHPNLVKLVGYCAEDDERGIQRLLVYELMHNKSLEDHLLLQQQFVIPWMTRLLIVQDAARGLAYLHEEMEFQLIFRDFKASNILLDEDFNAKLSDFGLAREAPPEGTSHVETSVLGTVGYAAPEYVQTGRLTVKSDVWSFGVVLYEVITGRRAVDCNLPRSEQKLLEWVKPYLSDSKKFYIIVDPCLEQQYCLKSARKLASLANKCLTKNPKSRPKMSEVVEILGSIISETSPRNDEVTSSHNEETISSQAQPEIAAEEVKSETVLDSTTAASTKQGGKNYLKKVLDLREKMNVKSKSIARIDWKNWTPGIVRTW